MRKHASSWFFKVILGAIIVSFVLFFGYSSFQKGTRGARGGGEGQVVLKVNGIPISAAEFEYIFDIILKQINDSMKGNENPEMAKKLAQSQTAQQLVQREILLQIADELGIQITDSALADIIKRSQAAQKGGEFDPIAYRHQFLPYFKNRFGLDYEKTVREDIRTQILGMTFDDTDMDAARQSENTPGEKTSNPAEYTWTFESVVLSPESLIESKKVETADQARDLANKLIAANPSEWKNILKPYNLTPSKVGPVNITQRRTIFGGEGFLDDYKKVFALTKESPVVDKPLEIGGKIYIVRLIDKTQKAGGENKEQMSPDFLNSWIAKLLSKAKIQDYLNQKQ